MFDNTNNQTSASSVESQAVPPFSIHHSSFIISPRKRRASVLILVVALLVLMALIGTAYISSTRIERYTSNQNSANTQVDLLLQGVVSTLQTDIVSDLFDTTSGTPIFKPSQSLTATANNSSLVDSTAGKIWLADRVPQQKNLTVDYNQAANPAGWYALSWPLMPSFTGVFQFDQPDGGASVLVGGSNKGLWNASTSYSPNDVVYYGQEVYLAVGGSTGVFPPGSPSSWAQTAKNANFFAPGFKLVNQIPVPTLNGNIAADADGDGVADAGLWQLPGGPINGITYYAAIRVVDNSAAVNVNTAWSMANDATTTPAPATIGPVSLFPSSVGLMELLNPAGTNSQTEIDQVNDYRFGATAAPSSPTYTDLAQPYNDNNTARATPTPTPDFNFATEGEELYAQLGRRLDNPGYVVIYGGPGATQAQAFPFTDSLNLATQFCINNSAVGPSTLAGYLNNSLNGKAAITTGVASSMPYPLSTTQVDNWFLSNFWTGTPPYDSNTVTANTPFYVPLRSILTVRNPVSIAAPSPANAKAPSTDMLPYSAPTWSSAPTYPQGAWVEWTTPGESQPKMYLCLPPAGSLNQQPDISPGVWLNVPWTQAVSKTNINTAEFRELWRTYYNTMIDNPTNAPFSTAGHVGQRMFKSSIRPPSTAKPMTDTEELELRAAVAAVNAEGLRSGNNNVISRTINLNDNTGALSRTVTVYSQQKQPFITEVFIETDGAKKINYIAIELYNPYEQITGATASPNIFMGTAGTAADINLGCLVGVVNRANGTIAATFTPAWAGASIPPGGYIVLTDTETGGSTPTGVTVASPSTSFQVTGLADALNTANFNAEILLTRTRSATGVPAKSDPAKTGNDPIQSYDESTITTADVLVPFEQFDINGFTPAATTRYDYCRPTPPNPILPTTVDKLYWRCVYPLALPGILPAQQNYYVPLAGGLLPTSLPAGNVVAILPTDTTNPRVNGSLGGPDPVYAAVAPPSTPPAPPGTPATAVGGPWPTIQLNAVDWPGPAGGAGAPFRFPFGGFPRLGDILQVPFIGSYRIYAQAVSGWTPGVIQETMSVSMDSLYGQAANAVAPTTLPPNQGEIPDPAPAATDNSTNDLAIEQIGRFCPFADTDPATTYTVPNPLSPALSDDYYSWASRIFDNFTIYSPHDEYFPLANPQNYKGTTSTAPNPPFPLPPAAVNDGDPSKPPFMTYSTAAGSSTTTTIQSASNLSSVTGIYNNALLVFLTGPNAGQCSCITGYVPGSPPQITVKTAFLNTPTANDIFRIVADPETSSAVQGLININTASWRVLATLPLARDSATGAIDNVTSVSTGFHNDHLAQAIVQYRTLHGPFKSIMDLNRVLDASLGGNLGFQSGSADTTNTIPSIDLRKTGTGAAGVTQGDYSPLNTTPQYPAYVTGSANDGVVDDFEKRFLAMTRISNLITTRSDSYTCYVLVQGWQFAGTAQATLVAQKRSAFIIDRSGISAANALPGVAHVPTP